MRIAITGATGFVGSHLVEQAVAAGHQVRALTRRPQDPKAGVEWIGGALDRPESLAALVEGVDAIVHVAGVVKGEKEDFRVGNMLGTEAVLEAAAHAHVRRFIHVSSLAAREPKLSAYGWSKCASEEPVIASGGDWTIVRPPAIYGPRDTDCLALFRAARAGFVPLPPHGRLSVIAVQDLCDLLLACLSNDISLSSLYEPDDGVEGGWSHRDFARAIGDAVGKKVVTVALPGAVLGAVSRIDTLLRGPRAKLTRDRAAYYTHPDWTVSPQARPPHDLWQPRIETRAGLAATADWYRAAGWLGGGKSSTKAR